MLIFRELQVVQLLLHLLYRYTVSWGKVRNLPVFIAFLLWCHWIFNDGYRISQWIRACKFTFVIFSVCRGIWESWKVGCLEIQWSSIRRPYQILRKQIATQHPLAVLAYTSKCWNWKHSSSDQKGFLFSLSSASPIEAAINRWSLANTQ